MSQPHQPLRVGLRRQVTATRATGKLVEWDAEAQLGWIEPAAPVRHPIARRNGGRILLREADIDAKSINREAGADVTFFIYVDAAGLGAMNCRPSSGPGVAKTIVKPASGSSDLNGVAELEVSRKNDLPRQVVSNTPILGRVRKMRGQTGWIEPLEALPEEVQGQMTNRGLIYMHLNDVEGDQSVTEGQEVLFCVYTDPQGLGAMIVTPTEAGVAAPPPLLPPPKAFVKEKKRSSWKKPEWSNWETNSSNNNWESSKNKADDRQRISGSKVRGKVIEWRRSFGWIAPDEEVRHPAASLRSGRIYVHKDDLLRRDGGLEPGQEVSFHVYVDSSGVGAEECEAHWGASEW